MGVAGESFGTGERKYFGWSRESIWVERQDLVLLGHRITCAVDVRVGVKVGRDPTRTHPSLSPGHSPQTINANVGHRLRLICLL